MKQSTSMTRRISPLLFLVVFLFSVFIIADYSFTSGQNYYDPNYPDFYPGKPIGIDLPDPPDPVPYDPGTENCETINIDSGGYVCYTLTSDIDPNQIEIIYQSGQDPVAELTFVNELRIIRKSSNVQGISFFGNYISEFVSGYNAGCHPGTVTDKWAVCFGEAKEYGPTGGQTSKVNHGTTVKAQKTGEKTFFIDLRFSFSYIRDGTIFSTGQFSKGPTFTVSVTTVPSPPVLTAQAICDSNSSQITLSWDSLQEADGYRIYRSTSENGTYTQIGGNITSTSYTDTNVSPGTTYYYKATAYNIKGESLMSAPVSATALTCIPDPPADLSVNAICDGTASKINVSWSASSGATGYKLYRSTSVSGTYTQVGGNLTATSYSDTSITAGTTYYYKVSAFNANGESAQSSAVSAVANNCALPDTPTGLVASSICDNLSPKINVTWNAVSGATGYKLYRSTSLSGTYSQIGDTLTTASYSDTSITAGTTYYYKVSATNDNGESAQSSAVSATALECAPTPVLAWCPGLGPHHPGNSFISAPGIRAGGGTDTWQMCVSGGKANSTVEFYWDQSPQPLDTTITTDSGGAARFYSPASAITDGVEGNYQYYVIVATKKSNQISASIKDFDVAASGATMSPGETVNIPVSIINKANGFNEIVNVRILSCQTGLTCGPAVNITTSGTISITGNTPETYNLTVRGEYSGHYRDVPITITVSQIPTPTLAWCPGLGPHHPGNSFISAPGIRAGGGTDTWQMCVSGAKGSSPVEFWWDQGTGSWQRLDASAATTDSSGAARFYNPASAIIDGAEKNYQYYVVVATKQSNNISGSVRDYDISASNIDIRPGETKSLPVSVINTANGFNGTVHFSVGSGCPSGWTCGTASGITAAGNISITAPANAAVGDYQLTVRGRYPDQNGHHWRDQKVTVSLKRPAISVPVALDFNTNTCTTNKQFTKTFSVTNTGSSTLDWRGTVSTASGGNWLSISPTQPSSPVSPGGSTTVTATANTTGLGAGTYSGTITISDPLATNSPQTISVTLTIVTSNQPTIGLSPASFEFNAVQGGSNPASKQLVISNSGCGTLNWTGSDNRTWLAISPATGSVSEGGSKSSLVSVNISGLAPGTYSGTITISDANATNNPQTAAVTLIIASGDIYHEPAGNLTVCAPGTGAETVTVTIKWTTNPAIASARATSDLNNIGEGIIGDGADGNKAFVLNNTQTGTYTLRLYNEPAGQVLDSEQFTLTAVDCTPKNFGLEAQPISQSVEPGVDAAYIIRAIDCRGGFNGPITLNISGKTVPGSIPVSLDKTTLASCDSGASALLTADTNTNTPSGGPWSITVSGQGSGVSETKSAAVELTVASVPAPNFSLSASPASRTITQGQSTTYSVTVSCSGGFNGQVGAFAVSNLHTGAAPSFSPAAVSCGQAATATITTSTSTQTVTKTITFSGTNSTVGTRNSNGVDLTVNPAAAAPTVALNVPASAQINTSFTISWSSSNAAQVVLPSSVMPPAGCTFSPALSSSELSGSRTNVSCSSTGSKTFQLTVSNSANQQETDSKTINITSAPTPDFSLAATPASRSITQGGSTTYSVSVSCSGGFSGPVNNFSVSNNLHNNASPSFNPASAACGGSTTLTISTGAATQTGTRAITISARGDLNGNGAYQGNETRTSNGVDLTVSGAPIINPPSNLQVSNTVCGQIGLTWNDNSTDETGFHIYRNTSAFSNSSVPAENLRIASVGVNVRAYNDTTSTPGQNHYYAVTAYNAGGESLPATAGPVRNRECLVDLSVNVSIDRLNGSNYNDGDTIRNGDTITFMISIENNGDRPAQGVFVDDTMSSNLLYSRNTGRLDRGPGSSQPVTENVIDDHHVIYDSDQNLGDKANDNFIWTLTFDARVDSRVSDSIDFIQNTARVCYSDSGQRCVDADLRRLIRIGETSVPTIREVAP